MPLSDNTKKVIGFSALGVVLAAGSYLGYNAYQKNKLNNLGGTAAGLTTMTRQQAVAIIAAYRGMQPIDSPSYDTNYLIQRARAIQMMLPTFPYGGKTYTTSTGKAVV